MRLIGTSGSLGKGSFNTKMLQAAVHRLQEGVTLTLVSCADLPSIIPI